MTIHVSGSYTNCFLKNIIQFFTLGVLLLLQQAVKTTLNSSQGELNVPIGTHRFGVVEVCNYPNARSAPVDKKILTGCSKRRRNKHGNIVN